MSNATSQTHVCLHVETKGETLFGKSFQKSGEISWDAWVSYLAMEEEMQTQKAM